MQRSPPDYPITVVGPREFVIYRGHGNGGSAPPRTRRPGHFHSTVSRIIKGYNDLYFGITPRFLKRLVFQGIQWDRRQPYLIQAKSGMDEHLCRVPESVSVPL